jgi:single-stranded-DNA-specific exonuclease
MSVDKAIGWMRAVSKKLDESWDVKHTNLGNDQIFQGGGYEIAVRVWEGLPSWEAMFQCRVHKTDDGQMAKFTLDIKSYELPRIVNEQLDREFRQAVEKLEAKIFKHDLLENKVLFVRLEEDDNFPSEMNGLIAMQLSAKYKKPTIVARLNNQGFDRGSARGMNQSELRDFKQFLVESGFFEYAQGHANAFGVSIPDQSLRQFHAYANKALENIDFGENAYDVNFIREASAADLFKLVMDLGEAGDIWGQNNPQPLVYVHNIKVNPANIRVMGANQDTVKIEANGMPYIKFHAKELIEELKGRTEPFIMEIVGKPNLNEWMGRISPQMFIEDYEIKEITTLTF